MPERKTTQEIVFTVEELDKLIKEAEALPDGAIIEYQLTDKGFNDDRGPYHPRFVMTGVRVTWDVSAGTTNT